MVGDIEMAYAITKESLKLVEDGKAVISSGGVRGLNGRLIELAKPALKLSNETVASPISLIPSVENKVNKSINKLDITLDKLDIMQSSLDSIVINEALGWANCAIGIVNCGISISGFAVTLNKLNDISDKLELINCKIEREIFNNIRERYELYCSYIKADIGRMEIEDYSVLNDTSIPDHLNQTYNYLNRIIRSFENNEMDREVACNIIYSLSVAFAREVKEYSTRYYYETGIFPANYKEWNELLNYLVREEFSIILKNYLIFECPQYTTRERYIAYGSAMYSVQYQIGDVLYGKELVQRLEKKEYFRLDEILMERIDKLDYTEISNKICINI
jgi:hypothetical protein